MTQKHLAAILTCLSFAGSGSAACSRKAAPEPATQALALTTSAPPTAAVAQASADGMASGPILETMNSGGYTYLRMQTAQGDIWVAANEFVATIGERVSVSLQMPMRNYHSKTLNRDFPVIYFVPEVLRAGQASSSPHGQPAATAPGAPQSPVAGTPVERIPPAPGSMSVADVWAKRTSLAGKTVVVHGKVVKVNNGIMDRNWIHVQDGSGSAADHTNDLTVTTSATTKVGDIVTASGVLAIGKDFGAGYAYDAILEQATVTPK